MSRASGMPASTSRSQLWTEKGHGSSMKSIRVFRWWGRDFQNFRASFSFRHPLKSSRQRQAGTMEASMVSRSRAAARLGLALIFPALNPLDSMMRMVAGLTQEGSVAWLAGMCRPSNRLAPFARASPSVRAHSKARMPSGSGFPFLSASSSSCNVASPSSGHGWMQPYPPSSVLMRAPFLHTSAALAFSGPQAVKEYSW